VNHLSTWRAGRSKGVGKGGSHQEGASQALAAARIVPQGGRRADVALCRCDSLRARLRREVRGLPIVMSCQEVSQPGGCIHLAQRSGWRRSVSTQDIRPRWHAGHIAAGWSGVGAAGVAGGRGGGALSGCWSSPRHRPSFACRTRFASNPYWRSRWKPAGKIWSSYVAKPTMWRERHKG